MRLHAEQLSRCARGLAFAPRGPSGTDLPAASLAPSREGACAYASVTNDKQTRNSHQAYIPLRKHQTPRATCRATLVGLVPAKSHRDGKGKSRLLHETRFRTAPSVLTRLFSLPPRRGGLHCTRLEETPLVFAQTNSVGLRPFRLDPILPTTPSKRGPRLRSTERAQPGVCSNVPG
jgi:hypothetical protein